MADQYHPDGQAFSGKTWHLQFKSYWLGCDDYRLPTGDVMTIPRSTADLSVEEFGEYMDKVEAWAATRGVWLED